MEFMLAGLRFDGLRRMLEWIDRKADLMGVLEVMDAWECGLSVRSGHRRGLGMNLAPFGRLTRGVERLLKTRGRVSSLDSKYQSTARWPIVCGHADQRAR
jgi:hypothetical protein